MIYVAGNGGLAAESEHFAAELMGKYAFEIFIPCISLTGPSSLITALANDIGFEYVFSHQLGTLGQMGDTFIGLTTSHSKNILNAVEVAVEKGMKVILLDGDTLQGVTTAEKQEYAVKYLHKLAYEMKRERFELQR
jgi:D-sedoheptulose 7-phosphate isomerase